MRKVYFIVLGFLLFGCAKKPVKIGVVIPLSQELSSYGKMCLNGIKLAAKVINEKGGIKGRKVELIVEDNRGEKETSLSAIEKFNQEAVVAVIGPLTTRNAMWVGEYADNENLPVIAPTATGIEATREREWVWRVAFTDPFQGITLAKFISKELKMRSVCIIINPHDPYSTGLCESFENEFKAQGGKVSFKATFGVGDTLFDKQLKVIGKQDPDGIFVPAFYPEAGLIIRQARDMGFTQPFIGGDGWDSPELSKIIGDRKGINYYSTHFFYNYGGSEVQELLHRYRTEFEEDPQTFSALGYDALMVVKKCFEQAGGVTRDEFKNNIKKVSYLGATGNIDFTQARDPRRSLMILKFEPGNPTEMVKMY